MLCKHQVIGSIPIGSTKSPEERRSSIAAAHSSKTGQRSRSAPTRRSVAATDGRKRCDTLTNIQMMKRNGSASAED